MHRLARVIVGVTALGLLAVWPGSGAVSAAPEAQHFGPYAGASPADGTCGEKWADVTFETHYTVRSGAAGRYEVTKQFKNGTFTTVAADSPEGCGSNLGATVSAGITGRMEGSGLMVVSGGTFNPSATCSGGCGATRDFLSTFFGPTATFDILTYLVHYNAEKYGVWKSASADRGGNQGDITG